MAGRPTKYSAEMQYRLCIHLQHGATHRMAAEAEGIGLTTFDDWLRTKPDFREAVRTAEATARTELLSRMMVAVARGNVQAMTWLLERLEPETFGPPAKRVQHSGSIALDVTALSDDDLDALADGRSVPAIAGDGGAGAAAPAASLRLLSAGE